MIELSEAMTLARQLNEETTGKTVRRIGEPSYEHKFTWFHNDVSTYDSRLKESAIQSAGAFGIFVEIVFNNGMKLNFHDGVNVRLLPPDEKPPIKYQLLIEFTDDWKLVFTVAMYGGFALHNGNFDNPYYQKSIEAVAPLSAEFDSNYFEALFQSVKPTLSTKAFLATEQRIPGLGNGSLQDILLACNVHPKRKIGTLSKEERERMLHAIKDTFANMTARGGRDTEKDLFGNPGGYHTILSKKSINTPCPFCGETIEKQTYLGGAVYYCSSCQPLE